MLYLELVILFLLICLNGVFAMSELAIVSSRKVQLRKLARDGSKAAAQALAFAEDTGKFLPSVQVGITLIGVLAGAFGGATIADHFTISLVNFGLSHRMAEFASVSVVVVFITYVTLVIGELVPKELALRQPEKYSMLAAPVVGFVAKLVWPAVILLNKSSNFVLRLLRTAAKPPTKVTQEEVEAMIIEGTSHGVFALTERDMLAGVMLLADKPSRTFMIPRVDVVSLDCDASRDVVQAVVGRHRYSRFPVLKHDDEQHVLGMVESRDVMLALLSDETFELKKLIKAVNFYPESSVAIRVLQELRASQNRLGIVVNEHGSFEGILTSTDLLNAVAGESYVVGEEQEITKRADGSWLIDGAALIDQVYKQIGLRGKPSDTTYDTLAGFVLKKFRAVPVAGDSFDYKDYRFEVVDMDGNRIDKVLVQKLPKVRKSH